MSNPATILAALRAEPTAPYRALAFRLGCDPATVARYAQRLGRASTPRPRAPGSLRAIADAVGRSHTAVAKALREGRCWEVDGVWTFVDAKAGRPRK